MFILFIQPNYINFIFIFVFIPIDFSFSIQHTFTIKYNIYFLFSFIYFSSFWLSLWVSAIHTICYFIKSFLFCFYSNFLLPILKLKLELILKLLEICKQFLLLLLLITKIRSISDIFQSQDYNDSCCIQNVYAAAMSKHWSGNDTSSVFVESQGSMLSAVDTM